MKRRIRTRIIRPDFHIESERELGYQTANASTSYQSQRSAFEFYALAPFPTALFELLIAKWHRTDQSVHERHGQFCHSPRIGAFSTTYLYLPSPCGGQINIVHAR